jgi:hypothetical protein
MDENALPLPELILLDDFSGNYSAYIDALHEIFVRDFVHQKTRFRGEILKLKWHPIYQEKAYTFYHITHKGEDEQNRTPDLRRCERLAWASPTIENCDKWRLKVWPQKRGNAERICIWVELIDEPDYFVILDVRKSYKLLWTAYVIEYPHEKRKKLKEYQDWLKTLKSPGNT